jgi:hypothetical protein
MTNKKVQKGTKQAGEAVSALAKDRMGAWVQNKQKAVLDNAVAEYAARHGGTGVDIDEGLEDASIEHLVVEEEKPIQGG